MPTCSCSSAANRPWCGEVYVNELVLLCICKQRAVGPLLLTSVSRVGERVALCANYLHLFATWPAKLADNYMLI